MPKSYQVYMPAGKRVYNVYMPAGKRVYNFLNPCVSCLTPNLIPNPNDMSTWTTPGSTVITPNAARSPSCENDANFVSLISGDAPSQGLYTDVGFGTNAIDLSFWIKKITQTTTNLRVQQSIDELNGRWDINFNLLGDNWELIDKNHIAVTEQNSWRMTNGDVWIDIEHNSGASPIEFYAWCWRAVEI